MPKTVKWKEFACTVYMNISNNVHQYIRGKRKRKMENKSKLSKNIDCSGIDSLLDQKSECESPRDGDDYFPGSQEA